MSPATLRRDFSPNEIQEAYRKLRLESEEARIRLHRVALPGEPLPKSRWRVEWGIDSPSVEAPHR